jgi:hypothetical protein
MTTPSAGTSIVQADYATFWLVDEGVVPLDVPARMNGLVASTEPGAAAIATGMRAGPAFVTVRSLVAPPSAIDLDEWDEVADISLEVPAGRLAVAGGDDARVHDLPVLTASGAGWYRVRVHARGRDAMRDLLPEEPVEEYLILTWPAACEPEAIHKATDAAGASRRLAAQQRLTARESAPDTEQEPTVLGGTVTSFGSGLQMAMGEEQQGGHQSEGENGLSSRGA